MNPTIQIAIDGPSGSGKSTLAKALSRELGILYVDTGALYRAIGLYAQRAGLAVTQSQEVVALLPKIQLDLQHTEQGQQVILNGENVSAQIRMPEIAMYASAVSALAPVRAFLLDLQRSFAEKHSVVMDGRDIGTVILPNATLKLFLIADDTVRAQRRVAELAAKGVTTTVAQILAEQAQRDAQDSSRTIAPLRQAEDAIAFDNSCRSVAESVAYVKELLAAKGVTL